MTNPPVEQPIPSTQCLREVYGVVSSRASHYMSANGSLSPQMLLMSIPAGATEPSEVVPLPQEMMQAAFSSVEGKTRLGDIIRAYFDETSGMRATIEEKLGFSPNLLVLVCEVWYVGRDPESAKGVMSGETPLPFDGAVSQQPDRREGVSIQLFSERGVSTGLCPVSRMEDGSVQVQVGALAIDMQSAGRLGMDPPKNIRQRGPLQ